MSVHPSSTNFGKNMGIGWREGLYFKYKGKPCKLGVLLEWKVFRRNKEVAGDIDAIIDSDTALTVSDLFPSVALRISPIHTKPKKGKIFLAEIKRSLGDNNAKLKIRQFVEFYYDLLRADGQSSVNIIRIPVQHRAVIIDPDATLLFVFNGEDLVTVEKNMRS